MKINWKVRIKNPHWWIQIALAVILPVLGYYGLTGADITTWGALWNALLQAVSNPYVLVTAAVSAYNAVVDPTTAGIGDSARALSYSQPCKDKTEEKENA